MHMAKFNVENNQKTITARILQYTGKREGWGLIAKGVCTCMRHNCHLRFKSIQKVYQHIKTIDTCHQ